MSSTTSSTTTTSRNTNQVQQTGLPHDPGKNEDFRRWCTMPRIFDILLGCDAVTSFIEETCKSFFDEVVKDIKPSGQRYVGNPHLSGESFYEQELNYWRQYDKKFRSRAKLKLEVAGFNEIDRDPQYKRLTEEKPV